VVVTWLCDGVLAMQHGEAGECSWWLGEKKAGGVQLLRRPCVVEKQDAKDPERRRLGEKRW
jgi:hypothetical protein